ncbi:MAG: hypothetical protein N2V77_00850 [Canidatus Methanoxibalbensis ujae]|nr:hypothetical protein [Candidatus Methanoxibalbensis ujae]
MTVGGMVGGRHMRFGFFIFCFVILIFCFVILSSAEGFSASEEEAHLLSVVSCEMHPAVFMPRDVGTITVTLAAAGEAAGEGGVEIESVYLLGRDVKVLSKPYLNIGRIAPGECMNITFTVRAPFNDGIYYPKLLIETGSGDVLRYSFPFRVDGAAVRMAVADIPEDIIINERTSLKIAVGNERPNSVRGVMIKAEITKGSGEVVPSEMFIGTLAPDDRKTLSLNFTPLTEGAHTLLLTLSFKNGMNTHTSTLSVHLNVSSQNKRPDIIISGIEYESDHNTLRITGDISNAGLSAARGVVVRVGDGEGFEAVYPYPSYFVGSLNPDDFSSFELNVRVFKNKTTIPIEIEFKDEDGNTFRRTEYVRINGSETQKPSAETSPILSVVLLIAVFVVVISIIYSWRKR